ncbi:heme o synthase [Halocatena pleomorpha]|uniref:Protoheme IX farnesyltransferase n=1 Tax=Halocatena pleomorpha TaxID=1785090 RepID=A0A3P3RF53_9EURY|nr:heme o synthase [Halocatena pleomorpha]RRJ32031.1 protoheme IX farnesyltransferase [Halocatena pleomorpha]
MNAPESHVVSTESPSPRFTKLLVAALVGVYLLVVVGATAALADAVRACSTWPLCSGSIADPQIAIALGHRLAAAIVAGLIVAATVVGWSQATTRVKRTLGFVLALYPIQIGVGAFVATTGVRGRLAELHLLTGAMIFVSLALALAWQLEAETGQFEARSTTPPADRAAHSDSSVPASAKAVASGRSAETGVVATVRAYYRLMKPRLMWLLCLVASAGMALAAGTKTEPLSVQTVLLTLGGGVLSIGASGTFNHVLERDVDRRMARTADRPLATDTVGVPNAIVFGVVLTIASIVLFAQLNATAALLGFGAIAFYSVVYTLVLKPNTVQNTVIGGVAGAIPALIGWAAVTGSIGWPGFVLAGVIFLWTPAHFYNLALAYQEDYERGGFPMMPIVRGESTTRKHIVYYLVATLLAANVLTALTPLGWLYASATVSLGAVFLWTVVRLHRERTDQAAFRAFHASNAYLGAILTAVIIDMMVL